jgi:alkane 1-monooxygenase
MIWYATASLTPPLLLALACVFGGAFPTFALFSITVFVFFVDKLGHKLPVTSHDGRALNLVLVVVHLLVMPLGIWAISTGAALSVVDKLLIFTTLGLFLGQISNSNAHELIHASSRISRRAGILVYITLLHGHHVSAHLRVHHVHAATDKDPNSARAGEGFWRYAVRAIRGEFIAGLHADTAQRARLKRTPHMLSHPYLAYVSGAAIALGVSYALAGKMAVLVHVALASYAQLQLLLSDYVQHYGLRRRLLANGKSEAVGPQHSWNAPAWYSTAMMLNAPKHSDHHMHPSRAFPALEITPGAMPMLPHSLPVMAVVALVPPLWRRVMDKRVARWRQTA